MTRKAFQCSAITVLFMLLSCTSCSNVNANQKSSSQNKAVNHTVSVQKNPKHIKKNLGTNLSIDAAVEGSNFNIAKVIKAKVMTADKNKIADILLKHDKIIKRARHVSDGSTTYEYDTADSTLEAGSSIFFATKFSDDYLPYLLCTEKGASWYSADKYSTTSDLPFMTRASAIARITKTLKSLGIFISKTYEGYSLDYKTMEKVQELDRKNKNVAENMKGGSIKIKNNWSIDDDCYYFTFHPMFGGLPIDADSHGLTDDTTTQGSNINICCSKRGILCFDAGCLYKQVGEESKASKIIGVNTALQAVVKKFSSIILTNHTLITHVRLCCVAVYADSSHLNYKLVPAWRFDGRQTIKSKSSSGTASSVSDFCVVINAVTGKEM